MLPHATRHCGGHNGTQTLGAECLFFLKLPVEIRQQVYFWILGGEQVHVVKDESRLCHVRCRRPVNEFPGRCNCAFLRRLTREKSRQGVRPSMENGLSDEPDAIISLLLTSRSICAEAISILYTTNTFIFNHPTKFLAFSTAIDPQHFSSIRLLRFGWGFKSPYPLYSAENLAHNHAPNDTGTWEETWAIIAKMEGLQDLTVALRQFWVFEGPLPREIEAILLKPLFQVTIPRVWTLGLNWPVSNMNIEDAPFQVVEIAGAGGSSLLP